jgi:hypothetical protein
MVDEGETGAPIVMPSSTAVMLLGEFNSTGISSFRDLSERLETRFGWIA